MKIPLLVNRLKYVEISGNAGKHEIDTMSPSDQTCLKSFFLKLDDYQYKGLLINNRPNCI